MTETAPMTETQHSRLHQVMGAHGTALEHAAATALGAVGHPAAATAHQHPAPHAATAAAATASTPFLSKLGQAAAEAEEAGARMGRGIRKKLQQVCCLLLRDALGTPIGRA